MSSILDNNKNLQLALKKNFPKTYDLIQYNPKGSFLYLKKKDVLKAYKMKSTIEVTHKGNDNFKAWRDYKKAVDKHLYSINSDTRLDKARDKVADKIYDEHYKRFPYWPSVGDTQTATVNITCYDGYERGEEYIAYACEGNITVTDKRERSDKYIAEFSGQPVMKIIYINVDGLKEFEKLTLNNWDAMKKKVDVLSTKSRQKKIMFYKGMGISDDELSD